MNLILLGDPEHALDSVSEELSSVGITAQINGPIIDGMTAVFCVSCNQSVGEKTFNVLEETAGRSLSIVAILLTEISPLCETEKVKTSTKKVKKALGHTIAPKIVRSLPIIRTGDVGWKEQVRKLIQKAPGPETLHSPGIRSSQDQMKKTGKKRQSKKSGEDTRKTKAAPTEKAGKTKKHKEKHEKKGSHKKIKKNKNKK